MEIIIKGNAKEIAAIVLEIQERQVSEKNITKTLSWVVDSLKNGNAGQAPKEADAFVELY